MSAFRKLLSAVNGAHVALIFLRLRISLFRTTRTITAMIMRRAAMIIPAMAPAGRPLFSGCLFDDEVSWFDLPPPLL